MAGPSCPTAAPTADARRRTDRGLSIRSRRDPVSNPVEEPLLFWSPNIAPGGLAIYRGEAFADWRGHAFIGGLAGRQLHRVALSDELLPVEQESLLVSLGQRIREVREGPDGLLYLLTDHEHGALLRIAPAPN